MSSCVLDTSALLALINQEPGHQLVAQAVTAGATICTVNLSEVVAKLADVGMDEATIHAILDPLAIRQIDLDAARAYGAGMLRPLTRSLGLSLGDRACLALAQHLQLPALTADRAWADLTIGVTVQVVR